MSKEVQDIKSYVESYRSALDQNVFDSQEYSIKLIQIPKISNTNRSDLAVEFVKWDELDEMDRESYRKISAIIKDKVVKREVVNAGKYKAGKVLELVNRGLNSGVTINHPQHRYYYYIFSIRPLPFEKKDNFDTDTNYCHYDEPHNDYMYKDAWVTFLIDSINNNKLNIESAKKLFNKKSKLKILEYKVK